MFFTNINLLICICFNKKKNREDEESIQLSLTVFSFVGLKSCKTRLVLGLAIVYNCILICLSNVSNQNGSQEYRRIKLMEFQFSPKSN